MSKFKVNPFFVSISERINNEARYVRLCLVLIVKRRRRRVPHSQTNVIFKRFILRRSIEKASTFFFVVLFFVRIVKQEHHRVLFWAIYRSNFLIKSKQDFSDILYLWCGAAASCHVQVHVQCMYWKKGYKYIRGIQPV